MLPVDVETVVKGTAWIGMVVELVSMTGLDEIGVRLVDPETTRLNWKRGTVWAADTEAVVVADGKAVIEAVGRLVAGATDVVPTEGRD